MKTTLNEIRRHQPCVSGWKKLLEHLGKTGPDDEPLSLLTVLESNGLNDALWCLRAVSGHDREIRLYAVWCARQVEHLLADQRDRDALNAVERYANGDASESELETAWVAARAAAWAAADAAAWTAGAAARAAGAAAWDAARAAGAAAWAAAWAAAGDAAEAATWAAGAAARAAAGDAARAAAGDAQKNRFVEMVERSAQRLEQAK